MGIFNRNDENQDEMQFAMGGPANGGPNPLAPPPPADDELDLPPGPQASPLAAQAKQLAAKQADADSLKGYLGVAGNVLQNFADVPSAHEMLYGGKAHHNNVKGMLDQAAAAVPDPTARQAKLYESYMNAKKMQDAEKENKYTTALDDPNSTQSKAAKAMAAKYNIDVDPGASGSDVLRLFDPKKMNEVSAQSAIDFDKQSRLLGQGKDADMQKMKMEEYLKEQARLKEIKAQKTEGMTEGRKAVDKDFAKDYNDWNSGGRAAVDKNLERLQAAIQKLKTDKSLTGPVVGSLPDTVRNFTNEKAISTRDDVRAAAQGALKATLGAQFTEKEGERIMNQAYNEKLSPEENIRKIELAVTELKAKRDAMEGKTKHFQAKGTLTGYDGAAQTSVAQSDTVNMRAPDGSIRKVPRSKMQAAINAGGSLVDAGSVAGGQ